MEWTDSDQGPEAGFCKSCNGLQFRKGYILTKTKYRVILISAFGNPDNNLESLRRSNAWLQGYCDSKLMLVFPEALVNYPVQWSR
jgi:hypothetical protein